MTGEIGKTGDSRLRGNDRETGEIKETTLCATPCRDAIYRVLKTIYRVRIKQQQQFGRDKSRLYKTPSLRACEAIRKQTFLNHQKQKFKQPLINNRITTNTPHNS
jgi:hypothetical protein